MSKDKRKNDIRIVCFINEVGINNYFMLNHEGGIGTNSPLIKELLKRNFIVMKKSSPVKPKPGIDSKNFFYVHEGVVKPRLYGTFTEKAKVFFNKNKVLLDKIDVREVFEKDFYDYWKYKLDINGTRIYKKSGLTQNRFKVKKTSMIGLD